MVTLIVGIAIGVVVTLIGCAIWFVYEFSDFMG